MRPIYYDSVIRSTDPEVIIMAFSFDNLKNNLANIAKKTGDVAEKAVRKGGEYADKAIKKGTEVAGIAKLNISLKERENELKKLLFELGKLTYNKADETEIAAKIVDIDDKKAEIAALKFEIEAANGKIVCKCGKEIDDDAAFCKYCGAKVEKKSEAETPKAEESAPKTAEVEETVADSKPLTTDEFVATFENVMEKYGLNK